MAQAFNFETRQLYPYNNIWNRGNNIKVYGAIWYIKERDGIYLIKNKTDHPTPSDNLISEYRLAKGLPAALLAQGDDLMNPNFDYKACYLTYFKTTQKLFPDRLAYYLPTILADWAYSLYPFGHHISSYFDNCSIMAVAVFLRNITNPYNIENLVDQINHNYYYTCNYARQDKAQLIFSQMPEVEDRREAPLIYASELYQPMSNAVLQADGFIAAVINLALFFYWKRRWSEYNFTDVKIIEMILKAYRKQEPIVDMNTLQKISFDLPIEVEKICKAYMEAFMPIMQKVWKLSPTVQLECIEGDNIYSYIYAHEVSSPDRLLHSELYANLSDHQKQALLSYYKRFLEWLQKNYPITSTSKHRVMQAMGKDLPPIELHLRTDVTITRVDQQNKYEDNGFTKLITESDTQAVLTELHRRVDGRRGKDIGIVIAAAAYKYHVLSRTPTESEFRDEFPNIQKCSWKSISEWLKKVGRPDDLRPDIKEVVLNF